MMEETAVLETRILVVALFANALKSMMYSIDYSFSNSFEIDTYICASK